MLDFDAYAAYFGLITAFSIGAIAAGLYIKGLLAEYAAGQGERATTEAPADAAGFEG